jgi:hypothetical protein
VDGVQMGSEMTAHGAIKLSVRVWGTRPLESLTILRGAVGALPSDVKPVYTCPLHGLRADVTAHDTPPPGASFYYALAKQAGEDIAYPRNISLAEGCRAWSSPVWVIRRQ